MNKLNGPLSLLDFLVRDNRFARALWMILLGLLCDGAWTKEPPAVIAVAANFAKPAEALIARFYDTHPQVNRVLTLSVGSTTQLYTQIKNGAPFDLLLAADQYTPSQLCQERAGVCSSIQTYAVGHLVLWSMDENLIDHEGKVLFKPLTRLALANPETAPYGQAAQETLTTLGLKERTQAHWVLADNVSQAYQFVATQNAPLGFVALSQIIHPGGIPGSVWRVPDEYHHPLTQDLILLNHGQNNAVVLAFMAFLKTADALHLIEQYGYSLKPAPP